MTGPEAEPAGSDTAEIEALFALVRQRYGARLTDAQLAEVREGVGKIVATARALRAVRLPASEEPHPPVVPFRAES